MAQGLESAVYPILALKLPLNFALAAVGPQLHIFELNSGSLDVIQHRFLENAHKGAIAHVAFDEKFGHIVTVGLEDKLLKVWDARTLFEVSSREIPKKATNLYITQDHTTILVADKFGDVFSYPLHPDPEHVVPKAKVKVDPQLRREGVASHENEIGTLVLGHASTITSMTLTQNDKYIVTADRDEHIRVSCYPEGYNIERFCLGHTKYVTSICALPGASSTLVSAGGDSDLYVWDYITGSLRFKIPITEFSPRYLVVSGNQLTKDVHDKALAGYRLKQAKKQENRAKRGKKTGPRGTNAPESAAHQDNDSSMDEQDKDDEPSADPRSERDASSLSEPEPQVIQNLSAISTKDGTVLLMWTILGNSALYFIRNASAEDLRPSSTIDAVDLAFPIVTMAYSSLTSSLLVALDVSHTSGNAGKHAEHLTVSLEWRGECFVRSNFEERGNHLARQMNELRVQATLKDLASLDLYTDLITFPKRTEGGYDGEDMDRISQGHGADAPLSPADYPEAGDSEPRGKKRGNQTGERSENRKKIRENLKKGTQKAPTTDSIIDKDPGLPLHISTIDAAPPLNV